MKTLSIVWKVLYLPILLMSSRTRIQTNKRSKEDKKEKVCVPMFEG